MEKGTKMGGSGSKWGLVGDLLNCGYLKMADTYIIDCEGWRIWWSKVEYIWRRWRISGEYGGEYFLFRKKNPRNIS
jgi:hypothetical protein